MIANGTKVVMAAHVCARKYDLRGYLEGTPKTETPGNAP